MRISLSSRLGCITLNPSCCVYLSILTRLDQNPRTNPLQPPSFFFIFPAQISSVATSLSAKATNEPEPLSHGPHTAQQATMRYIAPHPLCQHPIHPALQKYINKCYMYPLNRFISSSLHLPPPHCIFLREPNRNPTRSLPSTKSRQSLSLRFDVQNHFACHFPNSPHRKLPRSPSRSSRQFRGPRTSSVFAARRGSLGGDGVHTGSCVRGVHVAGVPFRAWILDDRRLLWRSRRGGRLGAGVCTPLAGFTRIGGLTGERFVAAPPARGTVRKGAARNTPKRASRRQRRATPRKRVKIR